MNNLLQYAISFSDKNEFLSQFTCLQPHFYVKYKI